MASPKSPNPFDQFLAKPDAIKTSHSEIELYTKCQRAHYYGYGMQLQSLQESEALFRGTVGHAALAEFYTALQEDESWEKALSRATVKLLETSTQHDAYNKDKIVSDLIKIMKVYAKHYGPEDQKLEVLGVEQEFNIPVGGDFYIKMYVDLIVRDYMGIEVWDHKFVYNFFDPEVEAVLPQLPKYLGALRSVGVNVTVAKYNELRYRQTKEQDDNPETALRRGRVDINADRVMRTMREQIQSAKQIKFLRDKGLEGWGDSVLRAANSMICKNCAFKEICAADLAGKDTGLILGYNYKKKESRDSNG